MAINRAGIYKQLFSAYTNSKAPQETIAIYVRLLSSIPDDELQAVVDQCIVEYKFLPTVSEIFDVHRTLTATLNQLSAGEAWGQVRKSIRRWHLGKPDFDDPLVEKAVGIMGWNDLCKSENQVADRARFLQIYAQLQERDDRDRKLLPSSLRLAESKGVAGRLTSIKELLTGFTSSDREAT